MHSYSTFCIIKINVIKYFTFTSSSNTLMSERPSEFANGKSARAAEGAGTTHTSRIRIVVN